MQWILDNLPQFLVMVGLFLLAIEILVLGFSTFVLFFVGIAAVVSGALMYLNLVESTVPYALLLIAGFTLLSAALFWKPLKQMQQHTEHTQVNSDLIGYEFVLEQDVSQQSLGSHHYSGIQWKVVADEEISMGTKVRVTGLQVGLLEVSRV